MSSLDPNTDKFYQGKYLSERDPAIDREAYSLPLQDAVLWGGLEDNFQHLTDTSNVEDLLVDPEDFCIVPEEAQGGCDEWGQVNIVATSEEFERNPIPNFAFYNFYLGSCGRGLQQQPTVIAIDDFYTKTHPDLFYRVQTDSIPNALFYGFYLGSEIIISNFYQGATPDSFYRVQTDSIPNSTFYGYYLGHIGKGRKPQTIPIAEDNFYIESVEFC